MRKTAENVQKTKIMASTPITSWQIDGDKVETVTDFIFLGSKITADSNCSHEIKVKVKVAQSYSTLCDPMEFSTVHGVPKS